MTPALQQAGPGMALSEIASSAKHLHSANACARPRARGKVLKDYDGRSEAGVARR
jgi:hypothetical protein